MPKTKILIALLLSIAIVSLIIGCPTTSDSTSDDSGGTTPTVDTTAPTVSSVTASGSTITIMYSEAIDLSAATDDLGKGFTVTTGADEASATTGNTVTLAIVDGQTLRLEVTDLLTADEVAKVAYIADTVIDTEGNQSLAGSKSATITADTTVPEVTLVAPVIMAGETKTKLISIAFNETVAFGSAGAADGTGFTVTSGTSSTSSISALVANDVESAEIVLGGIQLTLKDDINLGEKFTLTIAKDAVTDVAQNKIEDYTKEETTANEINVAKPKIDGDIIATSGEKTVTITFTENVTFADGKTEATAAPTGITVKTGETSAKATTANAIASAKITDKVLVLTLAAALPDTGVVKVAFRGDAIWDTAKKNLVAITKEATLVAGASQTEFYFYTDKTGKKENYAPTLTFFAGYENTITGAEQTADGADGTAKYQTLTGTGGSWASGGWNDVDKATVDLSTYNTLVFWVKSAAATSFVFRMEDVNENHESAPAITRPVTTAWVKQEISFAEFGISDASKVQGLVYTLAGTSDAIDLDEVYVYNMPDTTAPTVVSSAATGGSTSVAVTFSEAIGFGSGGSADGTGFTITDNTVTVAAITDKVLTLTVGTALPATGTFKVAFASNAITDKAATPNAFAGADSGDITITAAAATAPTDEPTAPTIAEGTVISVFSDVAGFTRKVAFGTGDSLTPGWGQDTVTTVEDLGTGKNVYKMANLNYQGLQFAAHDISCMDKIHLDYWTADATALDISLIGGGGETKHAESSLTKGAWTGLDLDIATFTNVVKTQVIQFKFEATGSPTIYLDNIYFYKSDGTGTANQCETVVPTIDTATAAEAKGTTITVNFSEVIKLGSAGQSAITVKTGSVSGTIETDNVVTGAIYNGKVLTVTVTDSIANGQFVVVIFAANAIADTSDNALAATETMEITASVVPTTAPTAPTDIAAAIKVYSEVTGFASDVGNFVTADWGGTVAVKETYASNEVLKYADLRYSGFTFDPQDIGSATKLYFDYWTADDQEFKFFVIKSGDGGKEISVAVSSPTLNAWTTAEIDVSGFSSVEKQAIDQLKIETTGQTAENSIRTTVYIDNIYFK